MKIYIMTDMECVSGITCDAYLEPEGPRYDQTRAALTADVNAAAEGCFQAGASEVVVRDGHGLPDNIILEQLDPRVSIAGANGGESPGIDETFDAALMIGQHAKAGTLDAFLDHTQSSRSVFDFSVNGISLGEIGQYAIETGGLGVPVIFLAGDDAACREAEALLPGIGTVSVGTACGRLRIAPRRPLVVRKEITEKVAAVVSNRSGWPPPYKLPLPMELRLTFYKTEMADRACRLRFDRERIDGRTIGMTVDDPCKILSIFV